MLSLQLQNVSKYYKLGEYNTASALRSLKNVIKPQNKQIAANQRDQLAKSEFVYALQDINFDVPQGEVLGIIGRNGAGKSTLLKLLSRVTSPSSGNIKINGRMASLLEVGTGFHPDLTGRENIFLNGAILGMSKAEIKSKLEEIVEFSGVRQYIDTPVKRYSSGMQVRLAFAVAAHLEPDIMIVDEVLAVGDADFQAKCIGKMKDVSGQGRTVLFVSHSMATIRSLCNRGILLQQGRMAFDGSVEDCITGYLKAAETVNEDGSVPASAVRAGNGTAQFIHVAQYQQNNIIKTLRFKQPIHLKYEINAQQFSGEILIGIQIKNAHNDKIVDYVNAYNQVKLHLDHGINKFETQLQNNLLPGRYYADITVANTSGVVLDSLENALEFTVSNMGHAATESYPYPYVNAYVQGQASWSMV